MQTYQKNCFLAIFGIVVQDDGLKEGISQSTGKPYKLKTIHLTDSSTQLCIPITLWGISAEFLTFKKFEPIAILKADVKDGATLNCGGGSAVWVNYSFLHV